MKEIDELKEVLDWFYGKGQIEPNPENLKKISHHFNNCVYNTTLDFFEYLNSWMSEKGYETSDNLLVKSKPSGNDCGWIYQVYQKAGLKCNIIIYRHNWLGVFAGKKDKQGLSEQDFFEIHFTAGKNDKQTLLQYNLKANEKDNKHFRLIDNNATNKNINYGETKLDCLSKLKKRIEEIERGIKIK